MSRCKVIPILDIETAPDAAVLPLLAEELDAITAPATYKDEAKIAAYVAEKRADAIAKLAVDIDTLRIIALGWATDVDSRVTCAATDLDEMHMLSTFWQHAKEWKIQAQKAAETHVVCGFYLSTFDIPAIVRRSQILGVTVPRVFNLDRYRGNVLDLADVLTFNRSTARFSRSLEFYASRFGLVSPDEPYSRGSDVPAWAERGDWAAIEDHLSQDLRITRALAERITA